MDVRARRALEPASRWRSWTVQLEGLGRRGAGQVKATGICHTDDFTLSGGRSRRGCSRRSSVMRAPASSSMVGPGVTSVKKGRPTSSRSIRRMPLLPSAQPQDNLCTAIRPPRARADADGSSRFSINGDKSTTIWAARPFRTSRCCRRSRSPRSIRTPLRQDLLIWLRRHHRIGAVINNRTRRSAPRIVFGLGGHRAQRHPGGFACPAPT